MIHFNLFTLLDFIFWYVSFSMVLARNSRMLRAFEPWPGRLSVCLFVILLYCVKTVQARITKSLLWAAPRTLVYRDKIL